MTISCSFSGGVNHKAEVSEAKQAELARRIGLLIAAVCQGNCAQVAGSVTVGSKGYSFSSTSTDSVD